MDQNLVRELYDQLRIIAKRHMSHEGSHTLQATELVNEAFLALNHNKKWKDKNHFLAYATQVMRNLLVQYARKKKAEKRGGAWQKMTLKTQEGTMDDLDQILDVHNALIELAEWDKRKARLIEMRYFAGLSIGELSEFFQISEPTVYLELKKGKGWLSKELAR